MKTAKYSALLSGWITFLLLASPAAAVDASAVTITGRIQNQATGQSNGLESRTRSQR